MALLTWDHSQPVSTKCGQQINQVVAIQKPHGMNDAFLHVAEKTQNNVLFVFIQDGWNSWLEIVWGRDAPLDVWEYVLLIFLFC